MQICAQDEKMPCRIGRERREKLEKEDVIFIVLEKLNERIPMDDVSRSLFAQLMLRMMNATATQSQDKTHTSHIEIETNSKTAV